MGGRGRGGGKQDSQGGGKREKKGNIMQHCAIFCNPKRQEPTNTGQEPGLKGAGSGRFKTPVPPPPYALTIPIILIFKRLSLSQT